MTKGPPNRVALCVAAGKKIQAAAPIDRDRPTAARSYLGTYGKTAPAQGTGQSSNGAAGTVIDHLDIIHLTDPGGKPQKTPEKGVTVTGKPSRAIPHPLASHQNPERSTASEPIRVQILSSATVSSRHLFFDVLLLGPGVEHPSSKTDEEMLLGQFGSGEPQPLVVTFGTVKTEIDIALRPIPNAAQDLSQKALPLTPFLGILPRKPDHLPTIVN